MINGCHGPRTRYQDRRQNLRNRTWVSRPAGLSKCKDSNAFTRRAPAYARFVPLTLVGVEYTRVDYTAPSHSHRLTVVLGKSMGRNVLQTQTGDIVALHLRGAYFFEVDRRPVLERARP